MTETFILIVTLFFNSCFILGLHEAGSDGQVLQGMNEKIGQKFGHLIQDGLMSCLYCMSTIWGFVFLLAYLSTMFLFFNWSAWSFLILIIFPFYTLSVCGLIVLIASKVIFQNQLCKE